MNFRRNHTQQAGGEEEHPRLLLLSSSKQKPKSRPSKRTKPTTLFLGVSFAILIFVYARTAAFISSYAHRKTDLTTLEVLRGKQRNKAPDVSLDTFDDLAVDLLDASAVYRNASSDRSGTADMWKLLALPNINSSSPVISIDSPTFSQVFYRANTIACGLHLNLNSSSSDKALSERVIFPMFDDGVGAGPVIDCTPSMVINGTCNPKEMLLELEIIKSLTAGKAFHFFLPKQTPGLRDALILNRPRMSSSTDIYFIDANHFVAASNGMMKLYLYEYTFTDVRKDVRLLDVIDTPSTNDLIDFDETRNLIATSQFHSGKQQLTKVNMSTKTLSSYKEIDAFSADKNKFCHAIAFYPSNTVPVIAASNMHRFEPFKFYFYDYEKESIVAEYLTESNHESRGHWVKGIVFVDTSHFLASTTALGLSAIRAKEHICKKANVPNSTKGARSQIILFKMNFAVEDIVAGKSNPVDSSAFTILGTLDWLGAADGVSYQNGIGVTADQANDRILYFHVDIDAEEPLGLISEERGYLMPHGVHFSKFQKHMAVTNYGDNSVIIQPTPHLRQGTK
mmetsp:Transcript_21846/g.32411  ORF Transcript_21846/g.32411 Transcript_21846/m.32411 type:complete len:565 (+) Transcript_21846:76-1770(+)